MISQIRKFSLTKSKYGTVPASIGILCNGHREYLAQGVSIIIDQVGGNFEVQNLYCSLPNTDILPFATHGTMFTLEGKIELVDMTDGKTFHSVDGFYTIRVIYTMRGEINILLIKMR